MNLDTTLLDTIDSFLYTINQTNAKKRKPNKSSSDSSDSDEVMDTTPAITIFNNRNAAKKPIVAKSRHVKQTTKSAQKKSSSEEETIKESNYVFIDLTEDNTVVDENNAESDPEIQSNSQSADQSIIEIVTESAPNQKSIKCPVCLIDYSMFGVSGKQLVSTKCGHLFCDHCIKEIVKTSKSCPNCRKKTTVRGLRPIYM